MKLVVDPNVVISVLIADSKTRELIDWQGPTGGSRVRDTNDIESLSRELETTVGS
jgi:hypothetical protein